MVPGLGVQYQDGGMVPILGGGSTPIGGTVSHLGIQYLDWGTVPELGYRAFIEGVLGVQYQDWRYGTWIRGMVPGLGV